MKVRPWHWILLLGVVTVAVLTAFVKGSDQSLKTSSPSSTGAESIREYYPLSVGNRWVYRVVAGDKEETVEWRVTQVLQESEGKVYVVWPFPSQADDEAMQLLWTREGLREVSSDLLILSSPARVGSQWHKEYESVLHNRQVRHRFRMVSVGKPCQVGKYNFHDCLVVEDEDEDLGLRKITEYARGVGPVRYTYFRLSTDPERKPMQSVELLSYELATDSNDAEEGLSWTISAGVRPVYKCLR